MYDYDSNVILQHPLKNRQCNSIATDFNSCYSILTQHDHEVKLFILDNE